MATPITALGLDCRSFLFRYLPLISISFHPQCFLVPTLHNSRLSVDLYHITLHELAQSNPCCTLAVTDDTRLDRRRLASPDAFWSMRIK